MKCTVPKKYTLWRMPRRKAFTPVGITLGTTVTFGRNIGQVWARGPRTKYSSRAGFWWVVTPAGRAIEVHESEMRLTAQCGEQLAITTAA